MDSLDSRILAMLVAEGDQDASEELVDRYVQRLIRLVGSRMSSRLGRRIDAEDVVQSVFRSFFRRSNEFELQRSGDLWRLLAAMAIKKVRKQAHRHTAEKRDMRQEDFAEHSKHAMTHPEPTPDHAVAVKESLEHVLRGLPEWQQQVFHMRLEGDSLLKIGHELQKSQRTVRRVIQSIKQQLTDKLLDQS